MSNASWPALMQGAYYLATGVWPLISIRTFMAVTGPKKDIWLVRTVGAVLAVIGVAIALAGWRSLPAGTTIPPEIAVLAVASAVVLTIVDVVYAGLRVIPKVYLTDAAVEVVLIAWWAWAMMP